MNTFPIAQFFSRVKTVVVSTAMLMLLDTGLAEVTVYWEEVGGDVRASWDGEMDWTQGRYVNSIGASSTEALVGDPHFATYGGNYEYWKGVSRPASGVKNSSGGDGFGLFDRGNFTGFAADRWVTNTRQPGKQVFDAETDYVIFKNRDLASMNADNFQNELIYQLETSDNSVETVRYVTSPRPVPEPATLAMLAMLVPSLLIRRKR